MTYAPMTVPADPRHDAGPYHDYDLCGLRLRSALPLRGFKDWTGDDRAPDIDFVVGDVPAALEGEVEAGLFMYVAPEGRVRIAVPGVADFLVEDGRRAVIAPAPGHAMADIDAFIGGSVFGALCHQRGLLPMHAASVEVGGGAVMMMGPSRAGKSTLSAALANRGHRLVADDVTVAMPGPDGRLMAIPAIRRQKLWQDSIDALGLRPGRRLRESRAMTKYENGDAVTYASAPVTLRAVVLLSRFGPAPEARLERLSPALAFRAIFDNVYRDNVVHVLGLRPRVFQDCGRIATTVPAFTLRRHDRFDDLDGLIEAVEHGLTAAGI